MEPDKISSSTMIIVVTEANSENENCKSSQTVRSQMFYVFKNIKRAFVTSTERWPLWPKWQNLKVANISHCKLLVIPDQVRL